MTEKEWNIEAEKVLLNRKIVEVRYMTKTEAKKMGWCKRPVCFTLDNGVSIIVSMDDEGNDGGSLFYGENGTLPTL